MLNLLVKMILLIYIYGILRNDYKLISWGAKRYVLEEYELVQSPSLILAAKRTHREETLLMVLTIAEEDRISATNTISL